MVAQSITRDQLFLSQKSHHATAADLNIASNLRDTLISHDNQAAGLAANMIGQNKQIIAFFAGPLPMVMLNPEIIKKSDPYLATEGCLSLDGQRSTQRYKNITVKYQDTNLQEHEQNFSDFTAEVIQHEIDHCKGILI
ncbi:peptide deformylase [uncultured Lactobacillus sp.]|uniref:peptide deformylase n=1 Tax=uncultured Lactobacillus sp. TaxID=153152 RepID=UPI0026228E9D|nr:peptide deformylase [uncultured Lactobacillus sp.]